MRQNDEMTQPPHFYSELAARKRKERGAAQRSLSYAIYVNGAYITVWVAYLIAQDSVIGLNNTLQYLYATILAGAVLAAFARVLYLQQRIESLGLTAYLYETIQTHNDALQEIQAQLRAPERPAAPAASLLPPRPSWDEHGYEACIEWFLRYARPRGTTQREFAEEVGISERHLQRKLKEYRDRYESRESV